MARRSAWRSPLPDGDQDEACLSRPKRLRLKSRHSVKSYLHRGTYNLKIIERVRHGPSPYGDTGRNSTFRALTAGMFDLLHRSPEPMRLRQRQRTGPGRIWSARLQVQVGRRRGVGISPSLGLPGVGGTRLAGRGDE
jgi:hypothetical protein